MQYLAGSIRHFFEFLEHYEPNQLDIPIHFDNNPDNIVIKYRNCWKSSCRLCQNDTQGELFSRIFPVYMWLSKYDQKWLYENLETPSTLIGKIGIMKICTVQAAVMLISSSNKVT